MEKPKNPSEIVPPAADGAVIRESLPPMHAAPAESDGPALQPEGDPKLSTLARVAFREAAAVTAAEPEPWREAPTTGAPSPGPFQEAADVPASTPGVFREVAAGMPSVLAGAARSPWPTDESADAPGHTAASDGDNSVDTPSLPGPTHADWRQLSDEVRRLAAQIAHGRA